MAEPFSIATGALQVAGAGLKLSQTLYIYVESVRKAEKQLKPVADHVKLTSLVLETIGTLLKKGDIKQSFTDDLLGSTTEALNGCEQAFGDLDRLVCSLFKTDRDGKAVLTSTAKFTLGFRQKELDVLQAHLERFKSSLDLVLGVLNLVSSVK